MYLSASLSRVFKRYDEKLMGLKDFGLKKSKQPIFGMKATLQRHQACGTISQTCSEGFTKEDVKLFQAFLK